MATDPPIGTKIRKRRQILGLTQQALASALGVSKSTVANWEIGKHFPRRYLGKVEDVLGVSLDEQDEERYARPVSPELRRLIGQVLEDDTEAQRRVIGLLEGTLTWPAPGAESPAPAQREERDGQERSAG